MKKFTLPSKLEEKIYELNINDDGISSKIVTYFPLSDSEKQEIFKLVGKTAAGSIDFKSIFSNKISQQEWDHSKQQIRKKFQDELVEID